MPSGRKSLKEEIGVLKRYNDLSAPYFAFIQEMLASKSKEDRKWAAERLDKAFVRMIPQQVGGIDGNPIEVSWLSQSPINPGNGQTLSITLPNVSSSQFRYRPKMEKIGP